MHCITLHLLRRGSSQTHMYNRWALGGSARQKDPWDPLETKQRGMTSMEEEEMEEEEEEEELGYLQV